MQRTNRSVQRSFLRLKFLNSFLQCIGCSPSFLRYLCAAARLAARVRSACAQCFECEHFAEDFRLPLRDAGAGWKSSWILVSFSPPPPPMEDVLLIDRVEDQLKEPEQSTGTVLGLELSNVPVLLAASSNTAPSGFSWRCFPIPVDILRHVWVPLEPLSPISDPCFQCLAYVLTHSYGEVLRSWLSFDQFLSEKRRQELTQHVVFHDVEPVLASSQRHRSCEASRVQIQDPQFYNYFICICHFAAPNVMLFAGKYSPLLPDIGHKISKTCLCLQGNNKDTPFSRHTDTSTVARGFSTLIPLVLPREILF